MLSLLCDCSNRDAGDGSVAPSAWRRIGELLGRSFGGFAARRDRLPRRRQPVSAGVPSLYDSPMADEARLHLRPGACAVFDAIPEQARARIFSHGFEVEVPRGGTIYREGDPPRCMLVLSGLIRVYMQSAEGRQVTVRYARPNDLLGVAVAVAGPAAVASQALVDSRIFAFDAAAIAEEGRRDAGVAWAIAEELGRRLYESLDHVRVNAFGSVRERIARHLLDAASPGKQGLPTVAVTQRELADAVGTAREVAARVVRAFRAERLVRTRPGGVVLLAPDRLAALASGKRHHQEV
jgi:CRP/FNR family cyclic AMP-dependent transcriptional regulator